MGNQGSPSAVQETFRISDEWLYIVTNDMSTPSQVTAPDKANYRLPAAATLENAAKFAVMEDKPIMMDYWTGSINKAVLIGVNSEKKKILIRNEEEYTSTIVNIYKSKDEYLVLTENSIYIVDAGIPTKKIA